MPPTLPTPSTAPPTDRPASAFGVLRVVGLAEGVSYLLLLFVAMPLKYLVGVPEPVTAVGWAHGLLFLAYAAAIAHAWWWKGLPLKLAAACALAALLPFGPFIVDRHLK